MPSIRLMSVALAVTPSRMFNSAAVAVTAVPLIDKASVSNVPSISASPDTSNEPASSSPVSVMFLKEAASLFESTTTALEAATVPAVIPSSISSSASVNSAPEPNVSVPVTVRLSFTVTSEVV